MGAEIKRLYTEAGLTPPNGKGIHTRKFHECVVAVTKKGGAENPNAVCMAQLGAGQAVKKSHRRGVSGMTE